jgi:hypothetical protein
MISRAGKLGTFLFYFETKIFIMHDMTNRSLDLIFYSGICGYFLTKIYVVILNSS